MEQMITESQEMTIRTNGVSHWLIVDGKQIRITRKDYFDLYTADDNEVNNMLAIMTGKAQKETP